MSCRQLIPLLWLASLVLAWGQPASALYIRPEIEQVPVEKLAENLEALAAKKPKDAGVRLNLARLHAMAYALKTDTASVLKGKQDRGAWFGFEPKHVPFKTKETDNAEANQAAKAHLEKAIDDYKQAIAIDKNNLTAQLGLGWCLKEAGKEEEAVVQLRKTLELGWNKEKNLRSGRLGGRYITVEATAYLMPLLDDAKDADEIAELKERSTKLTRLPRPVTPIAVGLTGDLKAADMLNRDAQVAFDADGTGRRQRWTWIHNNAAWLVYDGAGEGNITSAIQMFGSVTFWLFWDNGYQALAALDGNADGELTGDELEHLALWRDENENGISESGEVRSLAEHGIVAVNCVGKASDEQGVAASSAAGVRFADGGTRATFDLILHVNRSSSQAPESDSSFSIGPKPGSRP